jgi:hypothetical protein
MKPEFKNNDFNPSPYEYNYSETIDTIFDAIDTDDIEKIIDQFIESKSMQYCRNTDIFGLYASLEKVLEKTGYDARDKIKRALELIENYL